MLPPPTRVRGRGRGRGRRRVGLTVPLTLAFTVAVDGPTGRVGLTLTPTLALTRTVAVDGSHGRGVLRWRELATHRLAHGQQLLPVDETVAVVVEGDEALGRVRVRARVGVG